MSWRYFATRLKGDGTEPIVAPDLPLQDVEVTDELSGPGGLVAAVAPEIKRLKGEDGLPILKTRATAIYAEKDGLIRGGGILTPPQANGAVLELDCIGFSGYADGMPYIGKEYSEVKVDPLDVVRFVWDHIQSKPGGNLGLTVASTASPARIGKAEDEDEGEAADDDGGPFRLNEWSTDDLAKVINELAKKTPFDYHVRHRLEGNEVKHELALGYPAIGRRLHELRFVVGENVLDEPTVNFGTKSYATDVLVLGAGEGRDMVRGSWSRPSDGLRTPVVIEAKDLETNAEAVQLAEREARARSGGPSIEEEIVLFDHENAPLGSYAPGDEILLQTADGWSDRLAVWNRIISVSISPATNEVTLTIRRA